MNRAVNGDVVVVEVFDEKEWKAPADEVIDQEGELLFFCFVNYANMRFQRLFETMMLSNRTTKRGTKTMKSLRTRRKPCDRKLRVHMPYKKGSPLEEL